MVKIICRNFCKYNLSLIVSGIVVLIVAFFPKNSSALEQNGNIYKNISKIIKTELSNNDAFLLVDNKNKRLISHNSKKKLIPASTLKVLTSLIALHYLGEEFRFKTEFYLDKNSNLIIKGYGDPLLISEEISQITADLASQYLNGTKIINDIILDDSFFSPVINIPGVNGSSHQPYDAPNGALCANFNTVFFKTEKETGQFISAEPVTPLLPFVMDRIRASGLDKGRIKLDKNEYSFYAGHLFRYFLLDKGIYIKGKIRKGVVSHEVDKLIYTHKSVFSISECIENLLLYSNNFIANQLFLTAGAEIYGERATLAKGKMVADSYVKKHLKLRGVEMAEGSGISRQNRISADMMMVILDKFKNRFTLMKHNGKDYYKTGTLYGISTRIGFIKNGNKDLYKYVILLNTPGRSSEKIVQHLYPLADPSSKTVYQ